MSESVVLGKYPFLLPEPNNEIEFSDGSYGINARVPDYILEKPDAKEYVHYVWRDLYRSLVEKLTSIFIGRNDRFAVQFSPLLQYRDDYVDMSVILGLRMSILMITEQRMVIPVLEFEPTTGAIKEWRCGYCGVPQTIRHRKCVDCGAPRALLVHELQVETRNLTTQ